MPRPAAAFARLEEVTCRFGTLVALDAVSLALCPGEVHALLGPNGAGKTTLLRVLSGLQVPAAGRIEVLGCAGVAAHRSLRAGIGLVPSGDRSFYLRISGLENLAFFARMYGLTRREAVARALGALEKVGLTHAAKRPVGTYSHGMQKRLSVARVLLTEPRLLLVDEATHDLDPEGARVVRELVGAIAADGAAVLWATQRIDEIREFADAVTVLNRGRVRFTGSVPALMAHARPQRYVVRLSNGSTAKALEATASAAVAPEGAAVRAIERAPEHYLLALASDAVLGGAIAALAAAGIDVVNCREERSEVEEAFFALTTGVDA